MTKLVIGHEFLDTAEAGQKEVPLEGTPPSVFIDEDGDMVDTLIDHEEATWYSNCSVGSIPDEIIFVENKPNYTFIIEKKLSELVTQNDDIHRDPNNDMYNYFFKSSDGNSYPFHVDGYGFIVFSNKNPALEFNTKYQLYSNIFAKDLSKTSGAKCYLLGDRNIFLNFLSSSSKSHFYEYVLPEDRVKLFMDIDIKKEHIDRFMKKNKDKTLDDCFDYYISSTTKLINRNLTTRFGVKRAKYMVLRSIAGPDVEKLSGHIIYTNISFKSYKHLKFFFMDIGKCDLIDDKIIDPSVYKEGCFRTIWSSKKGKGNNLAFYEKLSKYKVRSIEKLFNDSLVVVDDIDKIDHVCEIERLDEKVSRVIDKPRATELQAINTNGKSIRFTKAFLKELLALFDPRRYKSYQEWIEVGMAVKNVNPFAIDVWMEWAQQAGAIFDREEHYYKWNSFNKSKGGLGAGSLFYWAQNDNPDGYKKLGIFSDEKLLFRPETFILRYLMDKEDEFEYRDLESLEGFKYESSIKFDKSVQKFMGKMKGEHCNIIESDDSLDKIERQKIINRIIEWNEGKFKVLSLDSAYDTGKTQLAKRIINELDFDNILWIVHRQSLNNDLYGKFNEFGFATYMDGDYGSKRLICQLESLPKLIEDYGLSHVDDNGDMMLPSYDLIIMDESESLLKHFDSEKTFKGKNREIFDQLKMIISNSRNVLAMDGDYGNRSHTYLKSFGEVKVMKNLLCPNIKEFKFVNKKDDIDKEIEEYVKNGKNIVIICMSSKIANLYHKRMEEMGIKSVLHNSDSDDELKNELRNVNDFWVQYQVVIYSPTIDAGVSFDVPGHFDKLFAVLCTKSTTPRGFLQMCFRVRHVKEDSILIYTNALPFRMDRKKFFTFEETKLYCDELYRHTYKLVPLFDKETGKYKLGTEYTLYDQIMIYNKQEEFNKSAKYFIPLLIKMLKNKYHNVVDATVDIKGRAIWENYTKEAVKNAKDICIAKYAGYVYKRNRNLLEHSEKLELEKYLLTRHFGIYTVNDKFMDLFFRKEYILSNFMSLVDNKNIAHHDKYQFDHTKEITYCQQENKCELIKELVTTLGYTDIFDQKKIPGKQFDINFKAALQKCDIFNKSIAVTLFKGNKDESFFMDVKKKKGRNAIPSRKKFLGEINSIVLKDYGIYLVAKAVETTIFGKRQRRSAICIRVRNRLEEFMKLRCDKDETIISAPYIDNVIIDKWADLAKKPNQ